MLILNALRGGKAKALVTGDRNLLSLARGFACPILSADQFIDSLQ